MTKKKEEKERERQKLSCLTEFPYNKYVRTNTRFLSRFFPKTAYELLIILPLTSYIVHKVLPQARTDAIISATSARRLSTLPYFNKEIDGSTRV